AARLARRGVRPCGPGRRRAAVVRSLVLGHARVALDDAALEPRRLTLRPGGCAVGNPVAERPAVLGGAPLERPGNADELALDGVGRGAEDRIAVAAHVEEREV